MTPDMTLDMTPDMTLDMTLDMTEEGPMASPITEPSSHDPRGHLALHPDRALPTDERQRAVAREVYQQTATVDLAYHLPKIAYRRPAERGQDEEHTARCAATSSPPT